MIPAQIKKLTDNLAAEIEHMKKVLENAESLLAAAISQQIAFPPSPRPEATFVGAPTRRDAVNAAKQDVTTFISRGGEPIFHVNAEKRVVVCLLGKSKGIARCSEGEVFNAHIGKAIALRRARGTAIPKIFLHAPAPDLEDLKKGTKILQGCRQLQILSRYSIGDRKGYGKAYEVTNGYMVIGWLGTNQFKVVDDTDAEYRVRV